VRKIISLLIAAMMLQILTLPVANAETDMAIYVELDGDDVNGDGSVDKPFKSLQRAQQKVREFNSDMSSDIIVYIGEGIHFQKEPISFSEADSGKGEFYVRYTNRPGTSPIISGGELVGGFVVDENGVWSADYDAPKGMVRELYVNGQRAICARTNEKISPVGFYDDPSTDIQYDGFLVDRLPAFTNIEAMELHCVVGWRDYHCPVSDIYTDEANGKIAIKTTSVFNSIAGSGWQHKIVENTSFWLENAYELMDKEGEFYYDNVNKKLYYKPYANEMPDTSIVVAPVLEKLINIEGSNLLNKVKNISFSGLTFSHTGWYTPHIKGLATMQANVLSIPSTEKFSPSGISIQAAQNIEFTDNVITGMGSVGIGLYEGVKDSVFRGNVFTELGDSAMSVGYPTHNFIEKLNGKELAKTSKVTCSEEEQSDLASRTIDGDEETFWHSSKNKAPYLQYELTEEHQIAEVHIFPRREVNQEVVRKNFQILGANKEDFSDSVVLAEVGEEPYPHNQWYIGKITNTNKFKFIRIQKTKDEYFLVGEVKIVATDSEFIPSEEECSNIDIDNNYIYRVGVYHHGTPGIQGYYTNGLRITHNTLKELPYSGVAVGWGWSHYPTSEICRNNVISNNSFERVGLECFDGGSIYTLGQMPDSVISGNYMKDEPNPYCPIYLDDGSSYITVTDNVTENVQRAFFTSTKNCRYNNVHDNYSTATNWQNLSPETNTLQNNTFFVPGVYSKEIRNIIDNAGVTDEYKHIVKDFTPNKYFGNEYYTNAIDDYSKAMYISVMINPFIKNTKEALNLIEPGNRPGDYSEDLMYEVTGNLNTLEAKVSQTGISNREYFNLMSVTDESFKKLLKSNFVSDTSQLVEIIKDKISNAVAGVAEGNYPQEAIDELNQAVASVDLNNLDAEDKNMLQNALTIFENQKVKIEIESFEAEGQVSSVVDKRRKTVYIRFPNGYDVTDVAANIVLSNGAVTAKKQFDFTQETALVITDVNGGSQKEWKLSVSFEKKVPIAGDWEYDTLDDEILMTENWYTGSSAAQSDGKSLQFNTGGGVHTYKAKKYGDSIIELKYSVNYLDGDYPGVVLRNKTPSGGIGSVSNDMYIIIFRRGGLEVQRFNGTQRTVLYGTVPGFETVVGQIDISDSFVFGGENLIQVGALNHADGVRLLLYINGNKVLDYVDNSEQAIREPGYFGICAPRTTVTVSMCGDEAKFDDLFETEWAKKYIRTLAVNGIVVGTDERHFEPSRSITRAEFLKMLLVSGGIHIDENDWYFSTLSKAKEMQLGIFDDYSAEISREEAAYAVNTYIETRGISPEVKNKSTVYKDNQLISDYALDAVTNMQMYGVMNGKDGNVFDPLGKITRAEAARVIYTLLQI